MSLWKKVQIGIAAGIITFGIVFVFFLYFVKTEKVATLAQVNGLLTETAVGGLDKAIDFQFTPDGRIFIATLTGQIHIFKNGQLLPIPLIELQVNNAGERGLGAFILDPNFENNGYIYIYYTYENNPADVQGPKTGRLSRFTVNGDFADPQSELVILGSVVGSVNNPSCDNFPVGSDCIPQDGILHMGGGLKFAPDGKLFFSIGDSTQDPSDVAKMMRVQNLDSLSGKLLRINPDGSASSDNPFYNGNPSANKSKIWAYGLRNPFSMGIQQSTGRPFIGDPGSAYWEEINLGISGANFGWPCYEGFLQHPENSSYGACQALYQSGQKVQHPIYQYERPNVWLGAAVIAGEFYEGASYPLHFKNAFFFADWVQKKISILKVDNDNQLIPESVELIFENQGSPIKFKIGPGGDIYYLTWESFTDSSGELRRIVAPQGNLTPVAKASASPLGGLAPLQVQFNGSASYDPEGGNLTYLWNFGDGNTSTSANPAHSFTQNGTYNVQLTVTDSQSSFDTYTLSIIVGNQLPEAFIGNPFSRQSYQFLQQIAFNGKGLDPENGPLAASQFKWDVTLHHCEKQIGGGCHMHPYFQASKVTSGNFLAPANPGNELQFLEVRLTVTDSVGLKSTKSIFLGHDSDGDGVLDHEEILTLGTNPQVADTDGNGTSDGKEDADGDGLLDYQELFILGTNRSLADSNSNGILDGNENFDGDSCSNLRELGLNEWTGGKRDPLNRWDFFDPNGDKIVDIIDVGLLVNKFGTKWGMPTYSFNLDRTTIVNANKWNLGPPDGFVNITDLGILISVYGHNCR